MSSPPRISLLSLFPPEEPQLEASSYPPGGAFYRILALLKRDGPTSTVDLQVKLNLSKSLIQRTLAVLKKRKEVEKVEDAICVIGKSAVWRVPSSGEIADSSS